MKVLELSGSKALEREEKLVEKIFQLQAKYKTAEARYTVVILYNNHKLFMKRRRTDCRQTRADLQAAKELSWLIIAVLVMIFIQKCCSCWCSAAKTRNFQSILNLIIMRACATSISLIF